MFNENDEEYTDEWIEKQKELAKQFLRKELKSQYVEAKANHPDQE